MMIYSSCCRVCNPCDVSAQDFSCETSLRLIGRIKAHVHVGRRKAFPWIPILNDAQCIVWQLEIQITALVNYLFDVIHQLLWQGDRIDKGHPLGHRAAFLGMVGLSLFGLKQKKKQYPSFRCKMMKLIQTSPDCMHISLPSVSTCLGLPIKNTNGGPPTASAFLMVESTERWGKSKKNRPSFLMLFDGLMAWGLPHLYYICVLL